MSKEPTSWTITQALSELKTLDKRINRLIGEITYVSYGTSNNQRKDDPVHKAVSKFQQLRDLQKLRDNVKSAIVLSNANTHVQIGTQTYTVAEAIERKSSIAMNKHLLETMKRQRQSVSAQVDAENKQAAARLQRLLESQFGKDNTKTDSSTLKQTEDVFWVNNRTNKIDPLNLDTQIERLQDEIDTFENNVDYALSESNSITRINVNA